MYSYVLSVHDFFFPQSRPEAAVEARRGPWRPWCNATCVTRVCSQQPNATPSRAAQPGAGRKQLHSRACHTPRVYCSSGYDMFGVCIVCSLHTYYDPISTHSRGAARTGVPIPRVGSHTVRPWITSSVSAGQEGRPSNAHLGSGTIVFVVIIFYTKKK